MKIGLHGKVFNKEVEPYIKQVLDFLRKAEIDICISDKSIDSFIEAFPECNTCQRFSKLDQNSDIEYMISLGGDGTLLEAVSMIGEAETPILGINTGRLGFLATTPKNKIEETLSDLLNKNYKIDARSLIKLESNSPVFSDIDFALNEFAILKTDSSSMITVHTFVDGDYLNSYWADGLIVSTPTGSTGYSLSCGGPIVLPHSNNFVITPVSAHNLNVRPLIVSDDSELRFEIETRNTSYLISLDSRSETIEKNIDIIIRKAPFVGKFIRIEGLNFPDTIRNKLGWGFDKRN